ncbi:nicotinate-nucleotide--dimethylbenzimidazole phosphoribosyltransferase [Jatrophihabitans cynanchi]|jgi:nicotinate-nucleotide--dimethylbenzimidazole phosphoribosyltransferase|uniref:Nicotinate-nucleotide--dimethylbenzimidazole phosphoribosyltransferase n=1 Tax=Jatrophihabitans cynanchi TaxID=2944128 RepID=A0ABY7K3Y8_9ACTN|nr:nicotinate-nucleotide--dimethylbenzimidazole phosphoribosyltransferase [Jatrophihabitans sp. SB3-54]WAX58049.1 nicotinate-nucleotide--dimethylbenzimidazole phosphoribosyltransferase [Jatrophihabitans sp. SB3-54]
MASSPVDLATFGADVDWPDHVAATRTRELAGPELGRLADLAEWLGGAQGAGPPRPVGRVRVVAFGAPASDAVTDLAADLDADVRVVDTGAAGDSAADSAETAGDLAAAGAAGASVADDEAERGTDLVVAAVTGSAIAAAVAVSVLTDLEPVRVLARGAHAVDASAWMRRAAEVRDTRLRVRGQRHEPGALLAELGDPVLAAAAAFVLRAAARRTPVLLDGPGAVAAALVGFEQYPRAVRWWVAADRIDDPVHTQAVATMGLRCVLDLGLTLGDGTAGLLALPVLRAACRLVREVDDAR